MRESVSVVDSANTGENEPPGTATGRVELVPGVVGPTRIVVKGHGNHTGHDLDLTIVFDDDQGRYVLDRLTVRRTEHTREPITGGLLRHVSVDRVVAFYTRAHIKDTKQPKSRPEPWGRSVPAGVVTERNVTDRLLQWVAHLYRLGTAVDGNGVAWVAECLDVPRSRAGRWVGFARERGHLEPATRE